MEKTPLELYETAYKLHYVEKNIPEAISYYELLTKGFPESNECGYAAIQLQKIKTGNLSKNIRTKQNSIHPLAVISFVIACLSLLACGTVIYYLMEQLKIEQTRTILTTGVLGKIIRGDDVEALRLLTELKNINKSDILPFELSADIYRRNHDFQKAKEEYELFFSLNPDLQLPKANLTFMKKSSDFVNESKSDDNLQKQDIQNENDSIFDEFAIDNQKKTINTDKSLTPATTAKNDLPVIVKKKTQKSQQNESRLPVNRAEKKHIEEHQSLIPPVKELLLVDPDSLSYF